jgi:hypothetical protein
VIPLSPIVGLKSTFLEPFNPSVGAAAPILVGGWLPGPPARHRLWLPVSRAWTAPAPLQAAAAVPVTGQVHPRSRPVAQRRQRGSPPLWPAVAAIPSPSPARRRLLPGRRPQASRSPAWQAPPFVRQQSRRRLPLLPRRRGGGVQPPSPQVVQAPSPLLVDRGHRPRFQAPLWPRRARSWVPVPLQLATLLRDVDLVVYPVILRWAVGPVATRWTARSPLLRWATGIITSRWGTSVPFERWSVGVPEDRS